MFFRFRPCLSELEWQPAVTSGDRCLNLQIRSRGLRMIKKIAVAWVRARRAGPPNPRASRRRLQRRAARGARAPRHTTGHVMRRLELDPGPFVWDDSQIEIRDTQRYADRGPRRSMRRVPFVIRPSSVSCGRAPRLVPEHIRYGPKLPPTKSAMRHRGPNRSLEPLHQSPYVCTHGSRSCCNCTAHCRNRTHISSAHPSGIPLSVARERPPPSPQPTVCAAP